MTYQGTIRDGLPTVTEVGRALGADVATLVEIPLGALPRISGTVIYDFIGPPRRSPGAIVFLIGAAPLDTDLGALFLQLSEAAYGAVVYKPNSGEEAALREAARNAGIAAFRAAEDLSWEQIVEFFGAAIVVQSEASRLMVDIRPGDLFEVANAVASLAGGAVAIADPSQTVLAYSTLPEHPIDDTRLASILRLHVPRTPQTDRQYRDVHAAQGVVGLPPWKKNSLTRSAVAIRAGDVVLGSLWLIGTTAKDQDAERLLLDAANVAALHLLHRRSTHDADRVRTVELVTPLLFDADRAELAAIQLGLRATEVRVAAFSAAPADGSPPEVVRANMLLFDTVRTACAIRMPGSICGFSDNVVYVVLPHTPSAWPLFQRAAVLKIARHAGRLLGRTVLAGIGSRQPAVAAVQSRVDAEVVLTMLLQDADKGCLAADSDEIVADAQSLGARLQLHIIATALKEAGQLPGDLALRIIDHDLQHKSAYEVTIRTFLDCNSNAVETAVKLGLHSNTVRYRLSRLTALFGIDLESPETRLLLWLQLRANHL